MSDVDRVKSGLVSFIQRTLGAKIINRIDYLALYPCKVIAQNGDGTLELIADDTVRVGVFNNVPIRYGVPGVTAKVPPGSRCYVGFGGGNPSKPMVVDWEVGTVLGIFFASGVNGAARVNDTVAKGPLMAAWMSQVEIAINALAPGSVTPLSASILAMGLISSGSAKVAIG